MALRKPFDECAATHRVITQQPSGIADADETGWITVENRVVDAVTSVGTAVHLRLEDGAASRVDPDGRLERVRGPDRILTGSGPEYRATLPDDADVVRSVLAVDPDDTDAWADRVFSLEEFVVRTDATWHYRSVPHHSHIRELHADGCDALLTVVTDTLESVPRSTVVPVDGLVTWQSNGDRYELSWDVLRRRERDADRDRWSAFELDRLQHVRPEPRGTRPPVGPVGRGCVATPDSAVPARSRIGGSPDPDRVPRPRHDARGYRRPGEAAGKSRVFVRDRRVRGQAVLTPGRPPGATGRESPRRVIAGFDRPFSDDSV